MDFFLAHSLGPSAEPGFRKTEFKNWYIQSFSSSQLETSLWAQDPMCSSALGCWDKMLEKVNLKMKGWAHVAKVLVHGCLALLSLSPDL